jgi:hypothetical protein
MFNNQILRRPQDDILFCGSFANIFHPEASDGFGCYHLVKELICFTDYFDLPDANRQTPNIKPLNSNKARPVLTRASMEVGML